MFIINVNGDKDREDAINNLQNRSGRQQTQVGMEGEAHTYCWTPLFVDSLFADHMYSWVTEYDLL